MANALKRLGFGSNKRLPGPAVLTAAARPPITTGGMAFHLTSIHSETNGRPIPCVIVTPRDGAKPAAGYVYLFHGITRLPFATESLASIYDDPAGLQRLADFHERVIVAPFLGRSFGIDPYVDPAAVKYVAFLTRELPAQIEAVHGAAHRGQRVLAGFSMGGYAAVSTLCRAPETFSVAVARAGVADLAHGVHDLHWDGAGPSEETLGPYWENQQRFHAESCFTLVNRLAKHRDVAIGLEVGLDDFLLPTNRRFRARLETAGVLHSYAELPGAHTIGTHDIAGMLATAHRLATHLGSLRRPPPTAAPGD